MFSNGNIPNKLLSSKKIYASIEDIRRKSIVKKVAKDRINSVYLHTYDPDTNYLKNSEYIIVPDTELLTIGDKKCKHYDIYNENLFKKNTKLYTEIIHKIEGSNLELKASPTPLPNPNNYERLMLYRKRNHPDNVLYQTCAIFYLLKNNYILVDDIQKINQQHANTNTNTNTNKHIYFEAYNAIDLAREVSHIKGEDFTKISNTFYSITTHIDNINLKNDNTGYPIQANNTNLDINNNTNNNNTNNTNLDTNIVSRYIINSANNANNANNANTLYPHCDIQYISNSDDIINSPSAPFKTILNANIEYSNTDDNSNLDLDYNKKSNELQCSCPEHHNINDKVQHFNNIIKHNK